MKHSKHTPGPWNAVYRPGMNMAGVHIKATDSYLEVGYCNSTDDERPEADARLMASAPEMLNALIDAKLKIKQLVEHVNALKGAKVRLDDFQEVIIRAIVRAKGEL